MLPAEETWLIQENDEEEEDDRHARKINGIMGADKGFYFSIN